MSLFSSLKKAANFITGGAADLSFKNIDADFERGSENDVEIACEVKTDQIEAKKVYFNIRCISEKIRISDDGDGEEEDSETVYEEEFIVDEGPLELRARQDYKWTVNLKIPAHTEPTSHYDGNKIYWEIFAGLDVKGNDPDTGWKEITVI